MAAITNTSFRFLVLVLISVVYLFSSCSVGFEKRRHTNRYYLNMHHQTVEEANRNLVENNSDIKKLSEHHTEAPPDVNLQQPIKKSLIAARVNEPCDRIYFADGTQAEVKVLDMNDREVVYRTCNDPNSPVIILSKRHIEKIEFASGARYETERETERDQNNRQDEVRNIDEPTNRLPKQPPAEEGIINILALFFAITGLVMFILAIAHAWLWLFGAVIFSALASSMGWFGINKRFKGLGIVALIIGTVFSILSSVAFVFL